MNKRRIAAMMIVPLMVLALIGCETGTPIVSVRSFAYPTSTPLPFSGDSQGDAAYAAAQATLAAGQSEIMGLSHEATAVSLDMEQAANAAAQATVDENQRRLMELSIRGTEVSQNMAWAAATQQAIAAQTQMIWNATGTAQSQAATATYSAYALNVTQTAHAQAILDIQATHTAQAINTQRAYSLTATPWAAIQAGIVQRRNESERRAWWGEFVVTPLKVILITLVVILLIAGGVMAYHRLMPALELRLRTISRDNDAPLLMVDGVIVDPDPPAGGRLTRWVMRRPSLPVPLGDESPQVEIISPTDPSVAVWIAEAEQKLHTKEDTDHGH